MPTPLPLTAPAASAARAESTPRPSHLPESCFQIVDPLQVRNLPPPSLEALPSELTLGLLHQVNNVLTGIYFNVEECREQIGKNDPISSVIADIAQATESLHRLLERAVDVNLPDQEDSERYHDLNALVTDQLDLVRIVFPKTVSIDFHPSSEELHVVASERDFRRIFLQMATCLRDTLPSGEKRLALTIRRVPAGPLPGTDRWISHDAAVVEIRGTEAGWQTAPAAMSTFRRTEFLASRLGWEILPQPGVLLPLVRLDD